jgi:hypothetical protein
LLSTSLAGFTYVNAALQAAGHDLQWSERTPNFHADRNEPGMVQTCRVHFGVLSRGGVMSSAMIRIVDAYVKIQNRGALEELRMHRRTLIETLQPLRGIDVAGAVKQNQDELVIIEAGIARLPA